MDHQYKCRNPFRSIIHGRVYPILILFLLIFIMSICYLSRPASSTTIDEDIVINGSVRYADEQVIISGNISIRDGGSLVFKGCDVSTNRSVYIDSGGELSLEDCNLTLDIWYTNHPHYSRISANSSSRMSMHRVQVNSEGWWTFGSGEEYRIIFEGNEFIMDGCTVTPSGLRIYLNGVDVVRINDSLFKNQDGIVLNGCNDSSIRNSRFIAPWDSGMSTPITVGPEFIDCLSLEIANCTFSYYLYYPLWLESCQDVVVSDCIIDCNHTKGAKTGLLVMDTRGLLLSNLTVARSTWNAIHLLRSQGVVLEDSDVMHSLVGLNVTHTDDFTVTRCAFFRNKLAYASHNATNGTLHENTFFLNERDAVDGNTNAWDANGRGNYWDAYQGSDGDGDGIGDTPHPVPNESYDMFPLMRPGGLDPLRLLSSVPANGQKGVDPRDPVILTFNQKLDVRTIERAVSLEPHHTIRVNSLSGWAYRWQVTLTMDPPLEGSTVYSLKITTTLQDILGRSLDREYTIIFTTVDDSPPRIELVSPGNGSWIRPGVPISIEVEDDILDEVMVDGGFFNETFGDGDVTIPTDSWTDGRVELSVHARDLAGNMAIVQYTFNVDGTPPVMVDLRPVNGSYLGPDAIIEMTFEDEANLSILFVTSWKSWTGDGDRIAVPTAGWLEGAVDCTVTASDIAGNVLELLLDYTVDRTSPVVELIGPEEGAVITLGSVIEVEVTDLAPLTSSVRLGDEEWRVAGTLVDDRLHLEVERGEEGPFSLMVLSVDAAGNEGTLVCWYWLDVSPPIITFSTPRAGPVFNPSDAIEVLVDEQNLGDLTVMVDGTRLHQGPGSLFHLQLSQLKDGTHEITGIATDTVGHRTEESFPFVVDGTSPRIELFLPDYGPYFTSQASVTVKVVETNDPVTRVRIDNGTELVFEGMSFQVDLSGLSSGWHEISVRAEDIASNSANITVDLMVDDLAPVITFSNLERGQTKTPGDWIGVVVEDALPLVTQFRLDDGPWEPIGEGMRMIIPMNITEGTHEIFVRSTDLVGNTGHSDSSFAITVEEAPSDEWPLAIPLMIIILVAAVLGVLWKWKDHFRGDQP